MTDESWEERFDSQHGRVWRESARLLGEAEEAGALDRFDAASRAGDLAEIRRLLAEWPILALESEAMCRAARSGSIEIGTALIEAGGPIDGSDELGSTPLMLAARGGHLEVCRRLVQAGARTDDPHEDSHQGPRWSALASAIAGGHRDVAEFLSPLTHPWLRIQAEIHAPVEPTPADEDLMRAAVRGDFAAAQDALDDGAAVDARTDKTRLTPLHAAAGRGDEGLVALLLDSGARIDARDRHGETALWNAIRWGDAAMVRLLCEAGADVDARGFGAEQTPLIEAAIAGRPEVVAALLAAGADPEATDHNGQSAEDYARYAPNPEAWDLLVRARKGRVHGT